MCKIEINGVSITLTKEQLEQIDKQRSKDYDWKDIKSYEDACKALNCDININATAFEKIRTIAKALNKGVKIDFSNDTQYKYCPYFKFFGGWVFFFWLPLF